MSSTTERFIRLYEELVAEVNRRAGAGTSHSFEIERAANRDGAVRKQQNLLKYIRDVRHALQHPKHRSEGHAVLIKVVASRGWFDANEYAKQAAG